MPSADVFGREEFDLVKEALRCTLVFQKEIISSLESNKPSTRNASRQLAANFEGLHRIVAHVHNQSRHFNLRQQWTNVDIAYHLEVARGTLR
jgi:hypothetical protein